MAQKKFYAVKQGRQPGIYTTWAECQKQTTGYKGAKFKGFVTRQEAEAYMADEEMITVPVSGMVAFVDGSYFNGEYSWGMAIYENGNLIFQDKGKGTSSEAAKLHNVAGEVTAAMEAVLWAEAQGVEHITICHDYVGISEWALGHWKTNTSLTGEYATFMQQRKELVTFVKVAGHTGVPGNELADKLAKAALEL
ncbi:MAG: ribonuclease H family protein [Anaerovibrio sp.]|uniref:ribonuclease H family protein n=1 Tax=Anaerovibrio sp. TaxID=1872532 RepID=UPI002600F50A|nr:ribonuclease H family protein [Anaerovibrio sp.]MCR5176312.1 ribonuclease H family protein [Anaerovibrio sp.]